MTIPPPARGAGNSRTANSENIPILMEFILPIATSCKDLHIRWRFGMGWGWEDLFNGRGAHSKLATIPNIFASISQTNISFNRGGGMALVGPNSLSLFYGKINFPANWGNNSQYIIIFISKILKLKCKQESQMNFFCVLLALWPTCRKRKVKSLHMLKKGFPRDSLRWTANIFYYFCTLDKLKLYISNFLFMDLFFKKNIILLLWMS